MNCTDPNLPNCHDEMCGCWHKPKKILTHITSLRADRQPIECKDCGVKGFFELNSTNPIWFTKGNFNRCKLCDKLANDYFEGNYFPDNSNTFVCAECCTLYTEDDLRIELEHESIVMLDRCDKMADRRIN